MKVFAKFDEIPSMILEVIKETNVTDTRSVGRSVVRSDNVKTVYPPTNTVCGGYKKLTNKHSYRKGKNYIPPIYFVCRGYN